MHRQIIRFFDEHGRLFAFFTVVVLFIALYLNTNHLNHWGPWSVPMFDFEKAIPFLPRAIYLYMTAFLMVPLAVFLTGRKDLGKTIAGFVGIMLICAIIFVLLPTAYPRPDLLPVNTGWFTQHLYNILTFIDTPKNCIPSQHAAACIFASLALYHRRKALGFFFTFWTIAILISTLYLKQHYLLDIIAGTILGALVYLISFRNKYDT